MPCDDERRTEPERVHREEHSALHERAGVAREHEHGREDGADARRRADGERAAEERTGAAPARAGQEARREHALGHGQEPDEGETEDDEHEAGDLRLRVAGHGVADRSSARAQHDEDDREAEDERQARRPPPGARSRARRAGRSRRSRARRGSRGRAAARTA